MQALALEGDARNSHGGGWTWEGKGRVRKWRVMECPRGSAWASPRGANRPATPGGAEGTPAATENPQQVTGVCPQGQLQGHRGGGRGTLWSGTISVHHTGPERAAQKDPTRVHVCTSSSRGTSRESRVAVRSLLDPRVAGSGCEQGSPREAPVRRASPSTRARPGGWPPGGPRGPRQKRSGPRIPTAPSHPRES